MKIDLELARRLERLGALNAADYAHALRRLEPASGAEVFAVGEGWGVLMGPKHPVNWVHAAEFGELSEADLQGAESRFARLGLPLRLSFCPLGLARNLERLGRRGYRAVSFMNLYVQPLAPLEVRPPEGVEIRRARSLEEWLLASRNAWGEGGAGDLFQRVALERPEAQSFVAVADGRPVAVAALRVREGVAFLNGTGTMPQYRGRGIQRALVQARLALAHRAGCELAVVAAVPGGQSAHNLERFGFGLAYTRVNLEGQTG
ncbi:MAG: GNAT family N-acetyltransferase [Meiothermus sp.]|nr:GNAT family N-acetyltransferase [Meiothermus sp.]